MVYCYHKSYVSAEVTGLSEKPTAGAWGMNALTQAGHAVGMSHKIADFVVYFHTNLWWPGRGALSKESGELCMS